MHLDDLPPLPVLPEPELSIDVYFTAPLAPFNRQQMMFQLPPQPISSIQRINLRLGAFETNPNRTDTLEYYVEDLCKGERHGLKVGELLSGIFKSVRPILLSSLQMYRLEPFQINQIRGWWLFLLSLAQAKMAELPPERTYKEFSDFLNTLYPNPVLEIPLNAGRITCFHVMLQQVRCASEWIRTKALCDLVLNKFPESTLNLKSRNGETPFTTFIETFRFRFLPSDRKIIQTLIPPHDMNLWFLKDILKYFATHQVNITYNEMQTFNEISPVSLRVQVPHFGINNPTLRNIMRPLTREDAIRHNG